ncbi:Ferroxidase [Jaapia argillacea MUCL 33604]|uniref:Ferroxidase n=1 Tax=Jaapia argillacea MUCL 33604 TaxID=933084 RepID=A0A067Q9D4_9AGAM|nr:Ferroxidase [Jaapia argillacea MUCL 33604]
MFTATSLIPVLLASVAGVRAGVQELWWDITYVNNANPDGLFERRVIGVNGTWPPPPIDVQETDSLIIHAKNLLDTPTSLHHHGMFFNSTSWMDGAVGVAQCGIPPGDTFDYVVPINSSGQTGTYWVHAHSSGQYVDGLRAPVVIHPTNETYKFDDEYTVVLGDWYHQQHDTLMQEFVSIANPGGAEPIPNAPLMYFAHGSSYLPPISGKSPSPVTAATGFNENATIPFQPGKTYKIRVVNTGAFAMFYFWIDGHDMSIVEVDGTDVQAQPVDMLSLAVAQRYSVLVTARNDTSANWAIHANMDTIMFDKVPAGLNPNATSIITYSPSVSTTNLGPITTYTDIKDTTLIPYQIVPQLPPSTKTIELEVVFDTMADGTNRAMFNMQTYNSPLVPAVFSALSMGENATVAGAYGPLSFVVDHLDVVDIVLKNSDAGKHPFHLHGHKMQIIHRAEDYTSSNTSLNPPLSEGQVNPLRRDTVQVGSMGSVTMRIVADNPGVWFFHCHIEWHLEVGLAIQLVEAPLEVQARVASGSVTPPQFMYDQCKALGKPTSGNAAGHNSTTDLSGLTEGPFPQNNGWHAKGIGAMFGCVLTAVIGMVTVTWYSFGGDLTEEEMEREALTKQEAKERKGRFFGLVKAS